MYLLWLCLLRTVLLRRSVLLCLSVGFFTANCCCSVLIYHSLLIHLWWTRCLGLYEWCCHAYRSSCRYIFPFLSGTYIGIEVLNHGECTLTFIMDCQNTLRSFERYPFSLGGGVRSCSFALGIVCTPLFLLKLVDGLKMHSMLGSILEEMIQG